jgi:DNA-binding HxlR family transcriptional regulator
MARATYSQLGDACATAHAMELIGARWTYPILRELMLGPKRFGGLIDSVRGITPAVLTSRLRELTAAGLVQPTDHHDRNDGAYALTGWALDLAPIFRELGRWAQAAPLLSPDGGLTPDAVVQAMITMAPAEQPRRPVRVELRLTDARVGGDVEHHYRINWDDDVGFTAARGTCLDAAAVIRADSSDWGRVLFAGLALTDAGTVTTGDSDTVARLVAAFR